MKISLNWLKQYVDIPVPRDELVRLIGARLVEVEGVIDETHKYDNIYIVRVESCEKIPDTHLTLCQIDVSNGMDQRRVTASEGAPRPQPCEDGGGEAGRTRREPGLIQVVCGAPNVREGMLAVWIAPGAIVPASVHEDAPFVIGKRKMRGYDSHGMLAGADELDFGDDHSGIVEIDPEIAKPGDKLADVFDLNDQILDIENKSLTHRPDCFGLIGFAREVAGILNTQFQEHPTNNKLKIDNSLKIKIENSAICDRYSAIVLEKHGELKHRYLTWQDTILAKSGMRPVDPIVDATNYLMLLTGQPLHAFDYDKFVAVGSSQSPEITVRLAREGESLTLLDDKEINLTPNDIVICSGDTPVALAGAMGGKSTAIDSTTRNIILESATFSLYNLRKTQMAHGIFSEAITRFTKGQPPYQTLAVAESCAEMLSSGYQVASVADEYPRPAQPIVVKITTTFINHLLGTDYDKALITSTLEHVGFNVKAKKDQLEIAVPAWRTDIHIPEDIVEEVGRLLGYDNIAPTLPLHGTADTSKMWSFKRQLRDTLSRFGANEVLTYSFVSERLLKKAGQDPSNSYKIINSISPELQYIRQSIVPSLLDKTYLNEKLPVEKFAIFEINKVYRKEWGLDSEQVPVEKMQLGLVVAERKNTTTAFYHAKWYAAKLLESLHISADFVPLKGKGAPARPFEPRRSAEITVDGACIGVVGEFKNSVRHEFKLAPYAAGFEIDLTALAQYLGQPRAINFATGKKEDVTITTDQSYASVLKDLQAKYPDAQITPGTIYQAPGQKTKNITFHLKY